MTKHKSNQDGFTSRGRGSVRRRRFSSILRVRTSRISRSSPSEAKQGGSGNRSVSPRRNPFREEIRKMKNWKDDCEPFHSTRNGSADICESMEDGKSPARRKVSSANNDQKQRDKDNVIKDWQENLEMKITKELLFLRKSKRPVEATVGAVNRVSITHIFEIHLLQHLVLFALNPFILNFYSLISCSVFQFGSRSVFTI